MNGEFGEFFARSLQGRIRQLIGADLQADSKCDALDEYLQGDLREVDAAFQQAIAKADAILLSTPMHPALEALNDIAQSMKPGAVLLDIFSVKTPVVAKMQALRQDIECLSLHPMFAPDNGFDGQNVVYIPVNSGTGSESLLNWLKAEGAVLTEMTADEHDRQAALIQAATHLSLIALGSAFAESGYCYKKASGLFTPFHKSILSLMARIATQPGHVYWQIQTDNPHAAAARKILETEIKKLNQQIDTGNDAAFLKAFHAIEELLPDPEQFKQQCLRMYKSLSESETANDA